ncbi:MAG TPA: M48 family metallopeptidase [Candidatus Sulfotelmatobacter sp.]|nr:M48 family metallopeptidase [Candidatus Sulfotelmatobacter sp.]
MKRLPRLFFFSFGLFLASVLSATLPVNAQAQLAPTFEVDHDPSQPITHYQLPADKLQKAHGLYVITEILFFVSPLYGLAVILLVLRRRWMVKFRDLAERTSSNTFLQSLIAMPLFAIAISILILPLSLYGHHVSRAYGISVQEWGSWFRDWSVQLLLAMILSAILGWILYAVIRRSPRRWWLYFWLALLPIAGFLTFIAPVAIDPLFNHYEPLQPKNPELVTQLERVVARSGMQIPPSRMYEMRASEKLTGSNAYVTGFGATKRVVVWDTSIQKFTIQQIMFVFGHELGHYVLGHIVRGFIFAMGIFLILFYLSYRLAGWMCKRWGAAWGIRGLHDWASLPLLWLTISVLLFISGPVLNAFSRHLEHQADQYGLAVVHGMFPDSGQVAAQSFQILGEEWLEYPNVSPLAVFLAWDHPPIASRIQFALTYHPRNKTEPEVVTNPSNK